jgi:CBS domain-containing protein
MRVDELMTQPTHCCQPEDTLERAAQLMWDKDCGCIAVCTGNGASRIVGLITDRDICMHALFQGKSLRELRVGDAMSQQVLSCRPHDSVTEAEATMRKAQIRRLPVTDERNALIGILSLADIAREALREQASPHRDITEVEVNDTLAAICEPSRPSLAV